MLTNGNRRIGLTLVELIVVVAIIATLATLTALFFPRIADREAVSRGADQLQGLLLAAKQQARRDRLPTGLRLYFDQQNGMNSLNQGRPFCRRVAFIQQPDDLSVGRYVGHQHDHRRALFSLPTGKQFQNPYQTANAELPVAPGDYLFIEAGGRVWRIAAIGQSYLDLEDGQRQLPGAEIDDPSTIQPYNPNDPSNYRIRRRAIPIPGEQEIDLPENVGIDVEHCRNVRGDPNRLYRDILFGPTGALIGTDTGNAQVILWIRDLTRNNAADLLAGHATLICVQPRTGFIAAHPAASGSDPYIFTRDARSSGM